MSSELGDTVDSNDVKPEVKLEIKIEQESDDESEVDGSDNLVKEIDIVPVEFEQTVQNIRNVEDEPKRLNAEIKVEKTDHIQIEVEEITKEENVVKKPPENYQNSCTPHKCTICMLECVSTSQLKIHLRVHTGEKPYSCSLCEYTSSQKGNLANHLRTHTKDKPFSCQTCGFRCKAKDTLNRHILRIHDKHKKLEIKEKADQSDTQDSHCEINTEEIKPPNHTKKKVKLKSFENSKPSKNYSCTICKLKFTTKSKLASHSRTHSDEKRHPCLFCNNKYAKRKELEKHINGHSEFKPYSCNKCGYKCKVKNYLVRHVCIHTGMKTFACSVCEFKTKDLRSLDVHMIIHGGRKPYSCKSCNKKFATWSALERHSATIQDGTRITNAVCRIDED